MAEQSSGSGDITESAIRVVVCWACPEDAVSGENRVRVWRLTLAQGATIRKALFELPDAELLAAVLSGMLKVAVFGEHRSPDEVLRDGDRIELLGPLVVDPKESRARRASVQRRKRGDKRWQRR